MLEIEITEVNQIEGGVEVFARAWKDGVQIGFGKDGSVDIERFRIFNPPVLVPDANGSIVRSMYSPVVEQDIVDIYREDPEEALLQTLEHNISVVGKFNSQKIIPGKIGQTTTTVYPDANTETNTVDGYTESGNVVWSTGRTTGNAAHDSLNRMYVGFDGRGSTAFIRRILTYFDTSSVPSGDSISSATYSVYRSAGVGQVNDGLDYLSVVQVQGNNVGSDTALVAGDHNDVGDAIDNPTEGIDSGNRYDISSGSAPAWVDFPLNSTGISWIAKSGETKPSGATSGITYLGLREGHDIEDVDPLPTSNDNQVEFHSADNTGTTTDPKLVIVHSTAAAANNAIFAFGGI